MKTASIRLYCEISVIAICHPHFLVEVLHLMWIPFETTNFRSDFEIGAKESLLHS